MDAEWIEGRCSRDDGVQELLAGSCWKQGQDTGNCPAEDIHLRTT